MKLFLMKIKGIFNKRTAIVAAALLLLVALFPEEALAAGDDVKETTEQSLGFLLSLLIHALNSFLWPFLVHIGNLMENDMIIGPGMEDRLLGIWVQVRNLVNIAFVMVLLGVALYNVLPFTSDEGNLALKTALPKVIIGLVLVNFTFLGGKLVLDLSNLATTAAFALPEIVEDFNFDDTRTKFSKTVCLKPLTEAQKDAEEEPVPWDADDKNLPINTRLFCGLNPDKTKYTGDLSPSMKATFFQDLNVNNVSLVMAVNMGALESQVLLKPDAIDSFESLVVNGLFSLIMYFVFAITYIVLGLVLITRVVVLWVAMALSPIGVLIYVVPQLKDAIGGQGDIVNKVTKHLLAPVIIGITLTIGYLMISALDDVGSVFNQFAEFEGDSLIQTKFLVSGIDDMERFIIAIASVVIVWTGVFAAAQGTFAETTVNGIKGIGERIAGAAAKAPLFLPTIPTGIKDGDQNDVNLSVGAAFGLLDSKLQRVEYGDLASDNLNKIRDHAPAGSGWAKFLGKDNEPSKNPVANYKEVQQLAAGDLTSEKISRIAQLVESSLPKGPKSTAIRADLKQVERSSDPVEEMRKILRNSNYSDEDFGFQEGQKKRLVDSLRGKTVVEPTVEDKAKTKPAAPATKPAAPAAPAPVDVDVANLTFGTAAENTTIQAALGTAGTTKLNTGTSLDDVKKIAGIDDTQAGLIHTTLQAHTPPAGPPTP